jgi:hypothetical protein
MDALQELPSKGQTFSSIRRQNLLYVDKTRSIHEAIRTGGCCFLSRPRRFGKSLLLGTMAEIFRGRRELFQGLWIGSPECGYDFRKYSVLHLSMGVECQNETVLESSIITELKGAARANGIKTIEGFSPGNVLKNLVYSILDHKTETEDAEAEKVVVLVDEYDAPILGVIDDVDQAIRNRKVLHGFYSALKTLSDLGYVHFMFVTGLTKFAKASVFSVFNNLKDLTLDPEYADICGFTVPEFDAHMAAYLPLALENSRSIGDVPRQTSLGKFREMVLGFYDGYSWDGRTMVLNPFSLINFLDQKELISFWYNSGTPTFLVDLIRENLFAFVKSETYSMSKTALEAVDVGDLKLVPLLFQTGYLTVDKRVGAREYTLREPNREVSEALNNHVLESLIHKGEREVKAWRKKIGASLDALDAAGLAGTLTEILREIPHEIHEPLEHYYQSVIHSFLKAWGFRVLAEERRGEGRVGLTLVFSDSRVFLFELKHEKLSDPKDPTDQKAMDRFMAARERLKAKALGAAKAQMGNRGHADKHGDRPVTVHRVALGLVGRTAACAEIY